MKGQGTQPAAASDQSVILRVTGVTHAFDGVRALADVSVSIRQGQLVGLIGPNGSGKTTCFNLITKIYETQHGSIEFLGRNLAGLNTVDVAELGIARTFQNPRCFGSLTVVEHPVVALRTEFNGAGGLFRKFMHYTSSWELHRERAMACLERVGLADEADRLAGALPYGKRRLVEIARCLARRPSLILLDEPTAGLNEAESRELRRVLGNLCAEQQLTLLVIEHDVTFIRDLCERLLVLDDGRLIADGPVGEVIRDEVVISAYLGETLEC
jgi:branched-chain amino acid transport system ATP-binding protein